MPALQAFGGEIKAVFLDVGGVLHLPSHAIVTRALRRAGVHPEAELLDRAHYAGVAALVDWPDGEDGIWTAYEEAYVRSLGAPEECVPDAVEELDIAFREPGMWSRLAPGAMVGLRFLHAVSEKLGVQLAIVSNSDGTLEDRLRNEGICQVGKGSGVPMTVVIDSGAVGVAKPDPAIFTIALDACSVAPDRALHIGDTVGADVDGARAAGIRPLHLDPYGFCRDDSHRHISDLTMAAAAMATAAQ
jgi:putative hydrolase of the HAD superfamily